MISKLIEEQVVNDVIFNLIPVNTDLKVLPNKTISSSISNQQIDELWKYGVDVIHELHGTMTKEIKHQLWEEIKKTLMENVKEILPQFSLIWFHDFCNRRKDVKGLITNGAMLSVIEDSPYMNSVSSALGTFEGFPNKIGDIQYDENNMEIYLDGYLSWDENYLIPICDNLSVDFKVLSVTNETVDDRMDITIKYYVDVKKTNPTESYSFKVSV